MTKRVCRACFQILSEEDCVPRSKNSGFVEQQTVEDVLKNVIPEMVVLRKEWYICKMCWVDIKKFYELKCHLLNREKDVTDYENVEDSETEMYSSDNNLPLNGTEVTTNKFAEVFIEDNADSTLFSEASANEPQKETNIRKRLKVKDITAKRSVLKILKSETTRTCRVCGITFSRLSDFRGHTLMHRIRKNRCKHCNIIFPNNAAFQHHKKTHMSKLICEVCGYSTFLSRLLEDHKLIHRPEKNYMCEKCGKRFKQSCVLWSHIKKIHEKLLRVQCPKCPKSFFSKYALKNHDVVHTGERNYQCPECSQKFTALSSVQRHLKRHSLHRKEKKQPADRGTSGKKYYKVQCNVCSKTLQKGYLARHMLIHTGEKPEKCEVCGRTFTQSQSLKRHMRVHTGERPYMCQSCGSAFNQKVELDTHTRRKHTGEKPYECKVCDKRFVELSILLRHRKTQVHKSNENKQG